MKVWYYDDLESGMRVFTFSKAIISRVSLKLVMDPDVKPPALEGMLRHAAMRTDRDVPIPNEPLEFLPERRRGRRRTEKPGPR